jgi:hypothetical protein
VTAITLLASGTPFSVAIGLIGAPVALALLEQNAAQAAAYGLSPNQDIAVAQLSAFAGPQ